MGQLLSMRYQIDEIVLVCEIQECSMTYIRQSKMYSDKMPQKLTLTLQPVSSKGNLQVVDNFENM